MHVADSHLHTLHSFDSVTPMAGQCAAALTAGVEELCFTEHFSLNPKAPTYGHLEWAAYEADFAACARQFEGRLLLRRGIELCEPHQPTEAYRELLGRLGLDMVVGSIHNVQGLKLRTLVESRGAGEACRLYFAELLQMTRAADIDVVAHLDLIKRYIGRPLTRQEREQSRPVLEQLFAVMVRRGLTLELNASMLESLGQFSPEKEALRLYAALGGSRLTFGSDAHKPSRVGYGFAEAVALARACGFDGFYTYLQRRPVFHPFEGQAVEKVTQP